MNYLQRYNKLIEQAKSENRVKYRGVYYESHHIIPTCIGGLNTKDNKVLLTPREHFVAHKLLTKIYPDNIKVINALGIMTFMTYKGRRKGMKISNRDYAYYRELVAKTPITEEKRQKLIVSHKGKPSPKKGIKHTPEQIEKNRIAQTGRKQSTQTKEKRRQSMIGKNSKPILQFDKDGNLIKEWHSTNEASRSLGIGDSGIWKAMNGERNYFGGFIWKYKNPK